GLDFKGAILVGKILRRAFQRSVFKVIRVRKRKRPPRRWLRRSLALPGRRGQRIERIGIESVLKYAVYRLHVGNVLKGARVIRFPDVNLYVNKTTSETEGNGLGVFCVDGL